MAKRSPSASLDFTFFVNLWHFYAQNRKRVRQHYRKLSRTYLDCNTPDNATAVLRRPQFEALDLYIVLKEFLPNQPEHDRFKALSEKQGAFAERSASVRQADPLELFAALTKEQSDAVSAHTSSVARSSPNDIVALTMGTGKTSLMATWIFSEFILATKFPNDECYDDNALVFAPDCTVLQALRAI